MTKLAINLDFGEVVKNYRKENNLSQAELAEFLGKDKSFISRIEKKDDIINTRKSRKVIKKIGKALNLDEKREIELEISAGLIPSKLLGIFCDEKIINVFTELAIQDLDKEEKKILIEDFSASLEFLKRFFKRENFNIKQDR